MRKTLIIVLTSCLALLLLAYTGFRGYQVWIQSHGIAMAQGYMARHDLRNTFLSLQQVLKTNPRNLEACRMVAALMEAEHAPAAVQWRQRVLELNPGSTDDRFALAKTAIANREYGVAATALAGASRADKQTAPYHNLAGMVALMTGQPAEAQAHFSESIRLVPSDPIPQLNLAVVRLHGTNLLDMADARIALQRLIAETTNAVVSLQARRELIDDAMRFNEFSNALDLSQDLVRQTNSVFSDKLLRLDVLRKARNGGFKTTLAEYETEASSNPADIADLAKWQMTNLSATNALNWLQQLPSSTRTNQIVEVLAATCQLQLKDWQGLQTAIQQQNWYDSSRPWDDMEFMRHAYLARSLRGQGLTEASAAEWSVATKSASQLKSDTAQKSSFKTLFDLAVAWGWNTEAEQILWTLVNQYPDEKWAYPVLRNALITWHRTRSLMQLFDTMQKRNPNDFALENNLAATALLLGDQGARPYALAQDVFQKDPTNPVCASTYAFSLFLQGKFSDALKVMKKLDPQTLQEPTFALYYGIILKANGDVKDAKAYLDRASKAPLLPEERALLDRARGGL
jgi:predicted Zn-dependent protease